MKCDRPGRARVAPRDGMVSRQVHLRLLGVCAALFTAAWAFSASAAVCYVNGAASGGNGSSWAAAYKDLQSALTNASCTEVWVAQGVYKPTTTTDRTISFNIKPGVAVYGGFAGGETSRGAADPVAHVTILSGDIDNNDANTDGNFIDETSADIVGSNSKHVVVMDGTAGTPITASTVLDGFTITGGDDSSDTVGGGGLLCGGGNSGNGCSPTLARLRVFGNKAGYGGGIALNGKSGGSSSPTLVDVYFSGNSATTFGGGLYNNGQAGGVSSPTLTNVTFSANTSGNYGGAMMNDGGGVSSPSLTNVTFSGNSASQGGAIFNNGNGLAGNANPVFLNVTFSGNHASYGGAMYDSAAAGGNSTPILDNVIFWGDTASNSYPEIGGYSSPGGNGSGGIYTAYIDYAIVQGDCQSGMSCSNLVAGDPMLGTLQDNGGFAPTLMPGSGSAAINKVNCYFAPHTDQRHAPRPDPASAGLAHACDLGAVEVGSAANDSIFVDGFDLQPYY